MGVLRDRLVLGDGPPRLRSSGTHGDRGRRPPRAGRVAGQADRAGRPDARRLDRRPRARPRWETTTRWARPWSRPSRAVPALLRSLSEPAWVAVFPGAPHRARLCLAAGLLQIHDFWDASHDAAQKADDLGERACLGLLARHRPSPRARRRQRRLLVSPGRQASHLHTARRGGPAVARRARRLAARRRLIPAVLERDGHDRLCTQARPAPARPAPTQRWRCGSCSRRLADADPVVIDRHVRIASIGTNRGIAMATIRPIRCLRPLDPTRQVYEVVDGNCGESTDGRGIDLASFRIDDPFAVDDWAV